MPELKFNAKIYKKEAIKKAISVYSSWAKFHCANSKEYIKVRIDSMDPSVKNILADEFSNYVLGVTKKCL